MNPDLARLQPYPFERLRELFADLAPPADKRPIALSVGEPQHAPPAAVCEVLAGSLDRLARYPATRGDLALREAVADWLAARHGLPAPDPEREVLPVNGTREALFAIAQTCVDRSRPALVATPNPFYQIYEGAAFLAGADVRFLDLTPERGFLPAPEDLAPEDWERCQLLYLCTPGNPSGAVLSREQLAAFVERALAHDVVLVSDECYSELYADEQAPPPGLLDACHLAGNPGYRNCLSFHSLSKRSNLPGLRSGFVAGDAALIEAFTRYRTYHGCAMPPHHQLASIAAWRDESHVRENRERYRAKFRAVLDILGEPLGLTLPPAGFYLWPATPIDDREFARRLYAEEGVTVLPGRYLGRDAGAGNPGAGRVRMALVAELEDCIEAGERIRSLLERLVC
jgi:N-succinyldiaminopimelate aminotransferase